MILTDISNLYRYRNISPAVAAAIDWLDANLATLDFQPGTTELPGGISVKAERLAMTPRDAAVLEAHRRFIDIHVPVKGDETMGWAPVNSLQYPRTPYDEDTDVATFGDAAHSLLHVRVGEAAIFFPEDAHAPNIGIGNHRKLCIKIPV
ncbi:MAG: YhcH/YjgK/YiaL family protein [Muribaculaceae bacterium]|nr:YhcH/YjgK/YiaL family protein [Muribaculaceae bacterium]